MLVIAMTAWTAAVTVRLPVLQTQMRVAVSGALRGKQLDYRQSPQSPYTK